MELEPRTTAPAHATGAVEFVPLAEIADDATFRLRERRRSSPRSRRSIGRLGHLVPVELRPLPAPARTSPCATRWWRASGASPRCGCSRASGSSPASTRRSTTRTPGRSRSRRRCSASRCARPSSRRSGRGSPRRATAPWADELVDEALVRAPVDPDAAGALPRVPLRGAQARPRGPARGGRRTARRPRRRGRSTARRGPAPRGGRRARRGRGGHARRSSPRTSRSGCST